ncbi:hypothetical protein V6N11_071912 [Hibiscus sabdariffa]|uniref:Uncharacterized protein n=1 Tax=Hibiscus sabdariffa TaxID=183260 RepID=A0ABR2U1H3_9ROSI
MIVASNNIFSVKKINFKEEVEKEEVITRQIIKQSLQTIPMWNAVDVIEKQQNNPEAGHSLKRQWSATLPLLRKQSEYQGGLPVQEATSNVHTDLRGNSSPEEEGEAVAVDSQQFDHLEPMVVSRADESAESTEPALPGVDGTELSVAEEPELSIGSQQATYENVEQASNEADVQISTNFDVMDEEKEQQPTVNDQ